MNILIDGEKCLITDWWSGCLRQNSYTLIFLKSQYAYSSGYNAPEIDEEIYGKKGNHNSCLSDVYSIGLLALRLCGISYQKINCIPKEVSLREFHDSVLKKLCMDAELLFSKDLVDIIRKMLEYDPVKRISLKEVITFCDY